MPVSRLCLPLAAALLGCLAACGSAAAACDRVAAPSGSDRNPGSVNQPFRTAQRLVDSLDAGDTGCLRAGTYDKQLVDGHVMFFRRAGRAEAPITVRSYTGERAVVRGVVHIPTRADGITLSGIDFVGVGSEAPIKILAADVTVENSGLTTRRRGWSCMQLGSNSSDSGPAVRPVIRGNVLRDCGSPRSGNKDHAIYAANVLDGEIVDNLIISPAAYAIQLYPNARRTRVAHNVVDATGSVRGGAVFGGDDDYASVGNVVEQNVFFGAATHGVTSSWESRAGAGNVARSNCVFAARDGAFGRRVGFTIDANVVGEPQFADRSAGDYRLGAGSPCRKVVGYDTAAKLRALDRAGAPAPGQASGRASQRARSTEKRAGCVSRRTRKARAACRARRVS